MGAPEAPRTSSLQGVGHKALHQCKNQTSTLWAGLLPQTSKFILIPSSFPHQLAPLQAWHRTHFPDKQLTKPRAGATFRLFHFAYHVRLGPDTSRHPQIGVEQRINKIDIGMSACRIKFVFLMEISQTKFKLHRSARWTGIGNGVGVRGMRWKYSQTLLG